MMHHRERIGLSLTQMPWLVFKKLRRKGFEFGAVVPKSFIGIY